MFKLNFVKGIFVLLLGFLLSISSSFADYPNKPIKLYIGYKAGGGTDTVGRVLAKVMSKELGQQVNIINKPGAGGCVAAMQVSKMKPDGYSLIMDPSSSVTWARHTNPKCKIKVILLLRKRRIYFDRLPTANTLLFSINFSNFASIGNLKSRLDILVDIMTLSKIVFSKPNFTVSISGSSGKS